MVTFGRSTVHGADREARSAEYLRPGRSGGQVTPLEFSNTGHRSNLNERLLSRGRVWFQNGEHWRSAAAG